MGASMDRLVRRLLLPSAVVTLLLFGCSTALVDRPDALKQAETAQWVFFGVVLAVQPVSEVSGASGDRSEPGMRMDILLDDGRSVLVEQLLSHAGKLAAGDRVRVLQIGGYSRVTYWPYPASR